MHKTAVAIMAMMAGIFLVTARHGINSAAKIDISKLPMVGIVR